MIKGYTNKALYKEVKEFVVNHGKFMSEDHLIHLKDDPKTVVSLYRIFMLFYKTNQMEQIHRKIVSKKAKKKD